MCQLTQSGSQSGRRGGGGGGAGWESGGISKRVWYLKAVEMEGGVGRSKGGRVEF